MFDRIYLLSNGLCVYHGPTVDMLPYFNSIGYSCEEHDNPADFALDLCQGDVRSGSELNVTNGSELEQLAGNLNSKFLVSSLFAAIENEKKFAEKQNEKENFSNVSFGQEFFYLCQRTLRSTFRNPALLVMQIFFPVFLALLIGAIYTKFSNNSETGTRNRFGGIFFIVANQVFGNLSALEIFLKERLLFVHENSNGYYRVGTYFLSKLICDLLPMRTIPSILFSVTVYFFVGFQADVTKFFLFLFGIFLTVICASSLCFFVSASVQVFGEFLRETFTFVP